MLETTARAVCCDHFLLNLGSKLVEGLALKLLKPSQSRTMLSQSMLNGLFSSSCQTRFQEEADMNSEMAY